MSAFSWKSMRGGSVRPRAERRRGRARRPSRFAPGVIGLEGRLLLSAVVTNTHDSGPGSLRDAVVNSAPGVTITFKPGVVGTITLTSGPILAPDGQGFSVVGPGASKLTVSGGGDSSILVVGSLNPVGATVTLSGLTFADGNASAGSFGGGGGAIADFGDVLTVSNSVFKDNHADFAGAIDSSSGSTLNLDHDLFTGNTAGFAAQTSGFSLGGAIFSDGTAAITSSTFANNQALGSAAQGGAIQTGFSTKLTVTGGTFVNDQAVGSDYGAGGAIFGDVGAVVSIDTTKFLNNLAQGAGTSNQVSGGAIDMDPGISSSNFSPLTATITDSLFSGNRAVATSTGTFGGPAGGGAISNGGGILALSGSTLVNNQAVGGGGTLGGGPALGGAVLASATEMEFSSDTFLDNVVRGGSGANGAGFAAGGAVNSVFGLGTFPTPTSTIADTLFLGNSAIGGVGAGGSSFAGGGALIAGPSSPTTITDSNFLDNHVIGSAGVRGGAGGVADGGAIENASSVMTITGGLIAGNTAVGGAGGGSATGAGGAGGDALGGGLDNQGGTLNVSGVTILGNTARGGKGGHGKTLGGAGGDGEGGGIASDTTLIVTGGLISLNLAIGGEGGPGLTPGDDGQGLGGGVAVLGGTGTLSKVKVFANFASTAGDDVYGPVTYT